MALKISVILNNKWLYRCLIFFIGLASILIFNISSNINFPDAKGYWLMAEGIINGRFSSWHFLTDYYPETLRTPGYPLFLAFCRLFSDSTFFVKIIQLLLYFTSVLICLSILKPLGKGFIYRNVFLLLLLPNVQIVYYSGYVASEMLSIFLTVLMIKCSLRDKKKSDAVILGIVSYLLFITKPAFLIFPFALASYILFLDRKNLSYSFCFILTFSVLLIPFGVWNKINHGKFKITSVEGGAGVAHLGFWQLKLPDGYQEPFYWYNNTSYDLTKPHFYAEDELEKNKIEFEKEWFSILNELGQYNSPEDSVNLNLMNSDNPGIFLLYNSEFTLQREHLLWNLTLNNIKENPIYYSKSRFYHLVRFYVTGINYKVLENSKNFTEKIKAIFPFFVTLIFIFFGLLLSTVIIFRRKNQLSKYIPLVLLVWYIALVHLPFAIQARYTVPVHLIIILITSISINKLILKSNYE